MSSSIELYLDLLILSLSLFSGIHRYKSLDKGGKVILFLLFIVFLDEIIARFFAERYHNNLMVYNVYGLIELCLIILYFTRSNNNYGIKGITTYLLAFALVIWVVNFVFFQSIMSYNSAYIFVEGFIIIVLALISFYRLLLYNEDLRLYKYHHFWFTAAFLFFWSLTYLTWGLYPMVYDRHNQEKIYFFIWIVNIVTYGSIGVIFQLYPKKSLNHE